VNAHNLTRRQLLGGGTIIGASGLTLAGLGGYAWPHPAEAATTNEAVPAAAATPDDARGVLHFVSRPDLTPPALTIAHHGRTATTGASDPPPTSPPPYFILTPSGYPLIGPGTPGLMILDRHGGIVCGQALMALADTSMVIAILAANRGYRPMTTVDQTTHFMRAITASDVLAEARVVRTGRTMSFGRVTLSSAADNKPVAMVSSAFAML